MDGKDLYETGLEAARKMWGKGRAERIEKSLNGLSPGYREFVIRAFNIYNRGVLDQKTRSLCNIAALTVLGRAEETRLHILGALKNGSSWEEIEEVILQMALYGGLPCANGAFMVMRKAQEEYKPAE